MITLIRTFSIAATYVLFLIMLYVSYACMCLGPNVPVRRWGWATWVRLDLLGPVSLSLKPVTAAWLIPPTRHVAPAQR